MGDVNGVIVISQEIALALAHKTDEEHKRDMKLRRKHYEKFCCKPDENIVQEES